MIAIKTWLLWRGRSELKKHRIWRFDGIELFERVVSILEQARANVVRSVNSNMALAYWMIGREIVEELQKGEKRAEYGKQVFGELSDNLRKQFGSWFSVPNLIV